MSTEVIGGLGAPELAIMFAVIMLFFGASRLPELARGLGRAKRAFREETEELQPRDPSITGSAADRAAGPADGDAPTSSGSRPG